MPKKQTSTPTKDLDLDVNPSSSRQMVLRSHCHGECKHNHSTSTSPICGHETTSKQNESVINQTPQMNTDAGIKINEDKAKNVVSARASVIQRTEFNLESTTQNFTTIKSSSKSAFDKVGIKNVEHKFVSPKTVHSVAPLVKTRNTVSMSNAGQFSTSLSEVKRISKYSDYSSGEEEIDFEDQKKTDYTYANSSSYCSPASSQGIVSPPNMSRQRLHSQSTPYSTIKSTAGYDNTGNYEILSRITKSYDENMKSYVPPAYSSGNGKHSNLTYANDEALSYGLDYESDEEEYDIQVRRKEVHLRERKKTRSSLMMIFDLVDCVIPVSTVWHKFWSTFYTWISSTHLLDTWILSRFRLTKILILLPLLLILLLLGGLLVEETEKSVTNVVRLISVPVTSFLTPFWAYFTSSESKSEYSPSAAEIIANSVANNPVNPSINPSVNPGPHINKKDVENIVRNVVHEEILKFKQENSRRSEENVENEQETMLKKHGDELTKLHDQMEKIVVKSKILTDELKTTKEKITTQPKSDHPENLHRLHDIEMQLESLKLNINLMQETQAELVGKMRNCCQNNTFDSNSVENHVTAMLLKIMGVERNLVESPKVLSQFTEWLKTMFVARGEFSSEMTSASKKIYLDLETETTQKAEAVARLAAAAAIRDTLRQHETRAGGRVDTSTTTSVTEDDIRKIIHDAILLYDADKTGLTDYALESAGGSIVSTRCSENHHIGSGQVSFFGIPLWSEIKSPRVVIQPGIHPGECWAFKGSEGYLVIQLSGLVKPTAFSIEHIPRSLAPNGNIDSALKDFAVLGLFEEKNLDGKIIGRYTYDANGEPLQYFPVTNPEIEAFPIVELRIYSNHGNLDYTCLYRFRVHGILISRR